MKRWHVVLIYNMGVLAGIAFRDMWMDVHHHDYQYVPFQMMVMIAAATVAYWKIP